MIFNPVKTIALDFYPRLISHTRLRWKVLTTCIISLVFGFANPTFFMCHECGECQVLTLKYLDYPTLIFPGCTTEYEISIWSLWSHVCRITHAQCACLTNKNAELSHIIPSKKIAYKGRRGDVVANSIIGERGHIFIY